MIYLHLTTHPLYQLLFPLYLGRICVNTVFLRNNNNNNNSEGASERVSE